MRFADLGVLTKSLGPGPNGLRQRAGWPLREGPPGRSARHVPLHRRTHRRPGGWPAARGRSSVLAVSGGG